LTKLREEQIHAAEINARYQALTEELVVLETKNLRLSEELERVQLERDEILNKS
jgi:hypothetical protein